MKKIALLLIATMLMLTCAVQANPIQLNYPIPDRLALTYVTVAERVSNK